MTKLIVGGGGAAEEGANDGADCGRAEDLDGFVWWEEGGEARRWWGWHASLYVCLCLQYESLFIRLYSS